MAHKSENARSTVPSASQCRRILRGRFRPIFLTSGRTGRLWLWPCRIRRTSVVFCFVWFSFLRSPCLVTFCSIEVVLTGMLAAHGSWFCPGRLAALKCWFSRVFWLLLPDGSLLFFGCSCWVVLSYLMAARYRWFTSESWLLRLNGSLTQFGCSSSVVLFRFMAARLQWFYQFSWLLFTDDSLPIPGCSKRLVQSRMVAALAEWFNPLVWLLGYCVSIANHGCFALMFLSTMVAARYQWFCRL